MKKKPKKYRGGLKLSYVKETTYGGKPSEPGVMMHLLSDTFSISVEVSRQEMAAIRHLVGEGLHGRTAGEVCERLIARELERTLYPRREA